MDLAFQYQKEQGKGEGIIFLEPVLFLQGRHWIMYPWGEFIGIIQDVPLHCFTNNFTSII